jgi:Cysteine-rich secretory protein family
VRRSSLLPRRHPNPIRRASALAGVALMSAALLAWTPGLVAAWNQGSAEATLWQLMNGDRVNNGRRPVQSNATLVSLARWRSKDMIQRDYFSHTVLGTNYMVFHWYDLNHLSYVWGGENIGWNSGYSDADSVVSINNAFMASSEHRANILEPTWTHGGVGAYGADNITWQGKLRSPRMYTELFMQAKSSAPPPAPKPTPPPPAPKPTAAPAAPAPKATPKPTAKPKSAPAATPSPDVVPLGASAVMEAGDRWQVGAGYLLAREPFERAPLSGGTVLAAYRIDAPAPRDRGFFETVMGTLLGFLF